MKSESHLYIEANQEDHNMDKQEEFFSQNQERLLVIAVWAKYLAWVALAIYILLVILQIIQLLMANDNGNFAGPTSQSLATMLRDNPFSLFRIIVNMFATGLRGLIYYVVLKGISLGLNVIVETDVNYREKRVSANE